MDTKATLRTLPLRFQGWRGFFIRCGERSAKTNSKSIGSINLVSHNKQIAYSILLWDACKWSLWNNKSILYQFFFVCVRHFEV